MNKAEIRKEYLQKRIDISPSEYQNANKSLHDILFSRIMMHRFSPIHLFSPILRKNEPDTNLIIKTLRADFAPDIFLPTVHNQELFHSPFYSETDLNINKWGIAEPEISKKTVNSQAFFEKYASEDILVLVPLLAFDKTGQRVGYGKGFYDTFLQNADTNTTIMGLSLFEALQEPISDVTETDIPMHFCITPNKVWTF